MKRLSLVLVVGTIVLGIARILSAQTIVADVIPQYVDGTDGVDSTPFAVHVTISGWSDCAGVDAYLKGYSGSKVFCHWDGSDWIIITSWVDQQPIHIDENGNWSGWYYAKYHGFTVFKMRAAKATDTDKYLTSEEYSLANLLDMSANGSWIRDHGNPPAGRVIVALDGSGNVLGTWVAEDNGINDNFPTAANYPSSPASGFWEMSVPAATDIAKLQARNGDNSIYAEDTSGWNSGSAGSSHELTDISLPVTFFSFSAVAFEGAIILRWSTESEVGILGFHVIRSETETGPYQKITTALIPSCGNSSMGGQYKFVDRNVKSGNGYWYKLEEVCLDGQIQMVGPIFVCLGEGPVVPEECRLFNNYPNPFNSSTTIWYHVSKEESQQQTTIRIYNVLGKEVVTLINKMHDPGRYFVRWDGKDFQGICVPSGIYFYQLMSGGQIVETKRMIMMK